ncbi:gamma-glutamyl kinase [Paracoccus panacisoli]|uniref:Gamma-glutamyl kinase n=1 Tax=Paracoccus panacisoli TaxID=1510163 RepID=A0ABV6T858_9RHOB
MLGFVAPRLVLLSVPKTGTTALEEALAPHAQLALRGRAEIKHLTLAQYHARIAPILRAIPGPPFRTVAVIREPQSWLDSWYRYRTRPQLAGRPRSTAGIGFDQFVEEYLAPEPRPARAALGRQSGFLDPGKGAGVDLLFRYEALDALVTFLEGALKTRLVLPRRNVSPPGDTALPPALAARLRAELSEDYALWDGALVAPPAPPAP